MESVTEKDSEALFNLLHEAHKSNNKIGIHFETAEVEKNIVREHIQTVPTFAYKNQEGELISTISIELPWSANYELLVFPHIKWFATSPKYKNRGWGKKLINQVIRDYVNCSLASPAVTIDTAINHPWLREFYMSLGFIPLKKLKLVKDHDSIYMIKMLKKEYFGKSIKGLEKGLKKYKR
ncbi:MAG: GNAT family N-acetyltransferase [Liquorilactobacillus ghanensis]|uniref:GNAT family N-acetyltransferase n=1 Tax=Liquorilactobacillus ghanensis TaxID=399370 RepID=UPI0039E75A71